jgi:elongation factor Ts
MANITASDVAKLRSLTGAGMMDCKKALEEADGNMDTADEILRKKGIVKAAKRNEKIAAEGITLVKTAGNVAVVAEVNSETDFVANNEGFQKLAADIVDHLLATKPASLDAALDGGIREKIEALVAKIGEKITLRRFEIVEKTDADAFGPYVHMAGKISVLILLTGTTDEDLAREVAMHTAASNPKYIERSQVPAEVVAKEKEIYTEQLKQQGKPENVIENILKGKIDKFYSEVCLVEQPYIKDEEKTIAQLVGNAKVAKMVRYELGEGLAKKGCDFAAEVAEQMAK